MIRTTVLHSISSRGNGAIGRSRTCDQRVTGSSPAGQVATFRPKVNFHNVFFSFYKNSMSTFQSIVRSMGFGEFYFNRGLQRLYTGTCIKNTINGFLCLLIVFLKSKTHQLNLKDVIKLNRNLR